MADTPNLVVIGGGPAGVAGALAARMRGAEVTVVERAHLGGTCVHAGCVPSAALRRAAGARRGAEAAGRFGIRVGEATTDWSTLHEWVSSTAAPASWAPDTSRPATGASRTPRS